MLQHTGSETDLRICLVQLDKALNNSTFSAFRIKGHTVTHASFCSLGPRQWVSSAVLDVLSCLLSNELTGLWCHETSFMPLLKESYARVAKCKPYHKQLKVRVPKSELQHADRCIEIRHPQVSLMMFAVSLFHSTSLLFQQINSHLSIVLQKGKLLECTGQLLQFIPRQSQLSTRAV